MKAYDRQEVYRICSRNSRTCLTKILYLNLGCVIYARKRFYVNKSGYTGNFLNIVLKAWITQWRELREWIWYIYPLYGISSLSKANAGWEGLRGQMILRAMPAVASATGRATLAGQVEGDGPDKRGYADPPGWRLGVRLTTSPCKK